MPESLPDALDLPPPFLVEAEGGRDVDSLKLLGGGNVGVCYDGMLPTDLIALNWPLAGSSYPPIEPQEGSDEGCINFFIPAKYIALWLDNFALFDYTVTRDGEDQTSLKGQVRISLPSNLPQVQILKTVGNTLDLSLLCCEDPVLYIPSWAFADTLQTINCFISGFYPDDSEARLYPFNDEPVTEEDVRSGWRRAIPREVFQQLKHDSELFVVASVKFGFTPYRSFPSRLLTLLTEPHLELSPLQLKEAGHTEFDGWVVNPINTVNGAHLVVAYEGMCSGDTVCPTFSGTPGQGSPSLECRHPVEGEASLEFAVAPSAISANFGQDITLAYNVTRCDGSHWSSPERAVTVLGITGLPRPGIEEATGNHVDLNTFSADATGRVPIWHYAAAGQACSMWVTGILEDGSAHRFDVLEGEPLTAAWLHDGVDTPISRAKLQQLADCSEFRLHFAVNFDGQRTLETGVEFPVRIFSIEQEAWVLPHPRVLEAVGDQLTIWNGRGGVTVRVEYEQISPRHSIQLKWIKADGTSLPLESKTGNSDPGYVDFAIPREAVIQGAGKTILIHYVVTSTCKLAPSKTLVLKISVPTRLPTPVVPEATPPATQGGVLDLRTFPGDAHITVNDENFDKAWWFALVGQRGWLECTGTKADGFSYTINVMTSELITAADVNDGLTRVLPREALEQFRDKTPLTIVFKTTADGSSTGSEAIVFPELKLTLHKRFREVTDFDPNKKGWNGWQKGAGATDPRDLVLKQGAGGQYYLFDWGYTNTRDVVTQREKLFRVFSDLEPGRTYEFSANVRDNSGVRPFPNIALVASGQEIVAPTLLDTRVWITLKGVFTASSSTVRLSLDNVQLGLSGNDFDVTLLIVEEV